MVFPNDRAFFSHRFGATQQTVRELLTMQTAITSKARPVPGEWMFAWNQGFFDMPSVWAEPT